MPNAAAAAVGLGAQGQGRRRHPGVGVRLRQRGHRPRVAQHRARRGRRRDLRRRRDQDRGGADRGVRADADRAVHHQRRPGRCLPPVRQGPQRVRVRRGRRAHGHRDRGARQGARRQHPGAADGRRHHLGRVPHRGARSQRRAGRARDDAGDPAGRAAPTDIDHVNAHATGTTVGDVAEGKAINNALGKQQACGVRAEVGARPFGRRGRRGGVHPHRAGVAGRRRPAHAQPEEPRSGDRSGRRRRGRRDPATTNTRSTIRSDSAGTTSRSPSGSTDTRRQPKSDAHRRIE